MSQRPFYFTWNRQPTDDVFPVEHAEHDEFVLEDGRRVYDFISTSFQANFGHSQEHICQRIEQQLRQMPIASPKATFALKQRVSERLCDLLRLPDGKLFYTVSGSESVENALKMARQITGRRKILARQQSYHGASLGALSVTGDWRNEPHFTLDDETVRIPEPNDDPRLEQTRAIIEQIGPANMAAVILETISGTNGVAIPAQEWFDGIQALCSEFDILLIVDEVLCGFGRTGSDFAFQEYNLQPDFVCLSKGITGGYIPFGAVWTGAKAVEFYDDETLACGLTNYAHPLGLAALNGVLDLFDDATFCQHKERLEITFRERLDMIQSLDEVAEIRCRGLLAAIELQEGLVAPTWEAGFGRGLHLYSKANTIIVAPPFVSEPSRMLAAFDELSSLLAETIANG